MGIRNVVGQAVSGEDYFDRPIEEKKLRKTIRSGNHILISAPRLAGKTTFLFHLMENPCENSVCLYLITQSIEDSPSFYKKLFTALVDSGNADDTIKITEAGKKITISFLEKDKTAEKNL